MILLGTALAGQGITWVIPPHFDGDAIVGVIQVEPGTDPDDLSARVDGSLAELKTLGSGELGVTTVLSFDGSGSFRPFSDAAFGIATQLLEDRPAADPVGLMVFGRKSQTWPVTVDPAVAQTNLAAAKALAASEKETRLAAFLLEAIDTAADASPAAGDRLRRVVVFTDAGEESGVFRPADVIEHAASRRVVVDAVVFARPSSRSFAEDLDRITRITRATGGTIVEIHGNEEGAAGRLQQGLARHVGIRVPHCGTVAPVEILGPQGFHADPMEPQGTPAPCAAAITPSAPAPSEPVDPSEPAPAEPSAPAQPLRPPDRLSGLVCLLLLFGFLAMAGFALWSFANRRRDELSTRAPTPAPAAPRSVPPPAPSQVVVDTSAKPSYSPAFENKLPETHLVVVDGELTKGTRWRFAGRMLRLGAVEEGNDVVVDLPQISGRHAVFEVFPSGAVFVEDLGSANGTYLDGVRLPPNTRTAVAPGQAIALSSQLTVTIRSGSDA